MKTYTEAEVQEMIKAQIALLQAKSAKATKFVVKTGDFTDNKGATRGFLGVEVQGNFRPRYLALSVAEAIIADVEGFKTAVGEARKPQPAKVDPNAPRLAPAKS